MKLPVDIHTHRLPPIPGTAVVNRYPDAAFAPEAGAWYSVGIHPWHIRTIPVPDGWHEEDARCTPEVRQEMDRLPALAAHPQVLAVGEAGLDRLADAPLALQAEIFEYQARLSAQLGKPLVIHLVKAVDELLRMKRQLRPAVPWIIHGFRGKAALAETLLRHGFHLSFGERYQAEALRITPADRLFLETDESALPVAELYRRAAEARGVALDELTETVRENIGKVFFKQ